MMMIIQCLCGGEGVCLFVCFLKGVQSFGNTQYLFVSETETILLFTASRFSV